MASKTRTSDSKPDPEAVADDGVVVTPEASEEAPLILEAGDEAVEVSEPEEAPPVKPQPQPRHKGFSVLFGLVLGGVIAAGIGFYAARYVVPEGWPFPGVTPEPDPLAVMQDAQGARLSELESQLRGQGEAIAALQADQSASDLARQLAKQLEGAEGRQVEMAALLNALDARLLDVEKIPRGSGAEAAEVAAVAYERELMQIRAMLAEELARIEAAQAQVNAAGQDAQAAAAEAALRAALAQVRNAQDSGQPFVEALDLVREATGQPLPEGLIMAAESGIATLPGLQHQFPLAARAALDASIAAAVADGSIGRFTGFLRSQLGTRSLEPRAGDDPDAILSRAEAALKVGQIAVALQEVAALPEAGQAEMANWVLLAQTRLDVLAATELLNTHVSGE